MNRSRKSRSNLPQPSNSKETKQPVIPESVKNDLVKSFVRYVLNLMNTKRIYKKADVKKHVFHNNAQYFEAVYQHSNKVLQEVYGLRMYDVPTSGQGNFIVVNNLENHLTIKSPKERAKYTVLFLILAHIFMSGGSCTEESIYLFLKKLQIIRKESLIHPRFGNIKTLILNEFPKMLYLNVKDGYMAKGVSLSQNQFDTSKSGSAQTFSWGPRADIEVSKEQILAFVSKIYGRSMESWPDHYKLVCQEKNQQDVTVVNDSE